MNKIFQIGFNKCGTLSIAQTFSSYTEPRMPAVHWHYGLLAKSIHNNFYNQKPLLSEFYNSYPVFVDIECGYNLYHNPSWIYGYKFFKILDEQYPNSKFILNIRDINNWIESRIQHICYYDMDHMFNPYLLSSPIYYWQAQCNLYKCNTLKEVVEIWKQDWYNHTNNVIQYFMNRPNDLLIYDIEKDAFSKFANFFKSDNLTFLIDNFPHVNKTQVGT